MPYIFHDRQSVPKWMPGGNSHHSRLRGNVCMYVDGVDVCAHNIHSSEKTCMSALAHRTKGMRVFVSVCPTQCAADTWHFPWSL